MRYSFVIPVYNRPEELEELLGSIVRLRGDYAYEVVIVEDGSTRSSEAVVARYRDQLPALVYLVVPNGGPSRARNLGVAQASGEYVLILDARTSSYPRAIWQPSTPRCRTEASRPSAGPMPPPPASVPCSRPSTTR